MSSAFANSGVFMVVKGDVKVTSKGKTTPAKVGLKVSEGDLVTTGADSRAKIVMVDKNVLNISPDSKVEITIYKNNQSTGEKKVELKVDEGKVRASVEQKYDDDKNTFRIKTPTAVAGVRGTDFSVSFNPSTGISQVVTFKGAVAFALDKEGQKPVLVLAGQSSNFDPSQASPSAPATVPQNELRNLDMETDASKTPDSANNSVEKGSPAKDPKETAARDEGRKENSNSLNNDKKSSTPRAPSSEPPAEKDVMGSGSMVSSRDLSPDAAKQVVDSSIAPRVPTSIVPPPVTNTPAQQATQNLITETVRNQIKNRSTKVKVEINR
jgi:hypothetical protein